MKPKIKYALILLTIGFALFAFECVWFKSLWNHFSDNDISIYIAAPIVLLIECFTPKALRGWFFLTMLLAQIFIWIS